MNHFNQVWDLRGVVGTLEICSQLVIRPFGWDSTWASIGVAVLLGMVLCPCEIALAQVGSAFVSGEVYCSTGWCLNTPSEAWASPRVTKSNAPTSLFPINKKEKCNPQTWNIYSFLQFYYAHLFHPRPMIITGRMPCIDLNALDLKSVTTKPKELWLV